MLSLTQVFFNIASKHTNYDVKCIFNNHFTDIDECEQGTSECDQICNNTDGSYICDCNTGFKRVDNTCEGLNL